MTTTEMTNPGQFNRSPHRAMLEVDERFREVGDTPAPRDERRRSRRAADALRRKMNLRERLLLELEVTSAPKQSSSMRRDLKRARAAKPGPYSPPRRDVPRRVRLGCSGIGVAGGALAPPTSKTPAGGDVAPAGRPSMGARS